MPIVSTDHFEAEFQLKRTTIRHRLKWWIKRVSVQMICFGIWIWTFKDSVSESVIFFLSFLSFFPSFLLSFFFLSLSLSPFLSFCPPFLSRTFSPLFHSLPLFLPHFFLCHSLVLFLSPSSVVSCHLPQKVTGGKSWKHLKAEKIHEAANEVDLSALDAARFIVMRIAQFSFPCDQSSAKVLSRATNQAERSSSNCCSWSHLPFKYR